MARTDARTAVGGSLDEVIRRAKAFEGVGADIIYVEAVQSREEVKKIRKNLKCALACSAWDMNLIQHSKNLPKLGLCMTLGVMFFRGRSCGRLGNAGEHEGKGTGIFSTSGGTR